MLAVGAPGNDDNGLDSGHTRVYQNVNGSWHQAGQDIDGEYADDRSGDSVALSDDGIVLAIGAPYNDDNGYRSEHVRVYRNVNGSWHQVGQDVDRENSDDWSGYSVALSANGRVLAIGAFLNRGNGSRVYQNVKGSWHQVGEDIDGENAGDWSGMSVALSADEKVLAIGSWGDDGNDSGHARVFEIN